MESNQNHYNLRNQSDFRRPLIRTNYQGSESISYLGPKVWDINPEKLKEVSSIVSFQKSVRKWILQKYPCRLCKPFASGVGFL